MIDPADPQQLDGLLRRHRITLRRRLGQNFLIDSQLRDAIADAAGLDRDDEVLEVGAGVGTLTIALARRARRVVAVELDRDLIPALRETVGDLASVEIVQGDILRLDLNCEFVVGNIPYNLTGELVRKLLDRLPRPRRLSLVVQKEVAERWAATTSASLATVAVQVFARPRIVMTIPAGAFTPVPRVDSAMVVLEVRDKPAVDVEPEPFLSFVEAVFQFRRKQLGGTLARIANLSGVEAARRLNELGVQGTRRPQTLSLPEWETVYRAFNPSGDR
ncbi:MAG TPA: 16S rRNA (adenine(1518)-N(6)/adenine(1519)-N(6))-dimethyltransferase RsmA [Candidatus Dormibacteraeota bacterium]|nr:16S rRNA (adenine(1518)-N(6)/adenine(1519)-N(6))-dimethyltransferase RsmA [Candidatus Dormibacteraeota bacterium]